MNLKTLLTSFLLVVYSENGSVAQIPQSAADKPVHNDSGQSGSIERDGTYIAYDDGTVKDALTNLMWASADNGKDISLHDAKSFCMKFRGGGYSDWRLPTVYELAGLYDPETTGRLIACGAESVHVARLISISCCCLWTSNLNENGGYYFNFSSGETLWRHKAFNHFFRVLPVRDCK